MSKNNPSYCKDKEGITGSCCDSVYHRGPNMASSSNSTDNGNNVPQWKRELLQRRKKVLASNSNGASVKSASGSAANGGGVETPDTILSLVQDQHQLRTSASATSAVSVNHVAGGSFAGAVSSSRESTCGATVATAAFESLRSPVAGNMRLEAGVCSYSEDAGRTPEFEHEKSKSENNSEMYRARRVERESDIFQLIELSKKTRVSMALVRNKVSEDCESDSSEELQYGPGIVNKLKSKYLNLTLRETNKSRGSVQRFRRAASLEDLLDCEEDPPEKTTNKYTKKNVLTKTERYRNTSRGNDSMKRARSVETLMRYNSTPEEPNSALNRFGSVFKQEPVNDHIILIDRTTVKIESRLVDADRPKAVNKPKRIKPVLAETERPPPDLVKTTMRIFEGSAKKLKPKGEVAVKVATFKTINDTFKAQKQKKITPKPPLQPKPFTNGTNRGPSSPKKIVLSQKPPSELIGKQDRLEEYRNEGVITDPIVQSVSSVVSKFQQIEKLHSPSASPEPSFKIKFSPAPSPEPSLNKLKSSLEIIVKSPPVTPVLSPRISSPRLSSPASPKKDVTRQNSVPVHKPSPSSPSREFVKQISAPEAPKFCHQMEKENLEPTCDAKQDDNIQSPEIEVLESENNEFMEIKEYREHKELTEGKEPKEIKEMNISSPAEAEKDVEAVDGPRSVSKSALDNIGKAGTTMQFTFDNKSTNDKSYLPGATSNGQKLSKDLPLENNLELVKSKSLSLIKATPSDDAALNNQARIQERLGSGNNEKNSVFNKGESPNVVDNRPIGAISSLGLIRSMTMTTYHQGNESKTIRYQRSESISPPQKQIGIIRPLVSTKTQLPQQNLSDRELEKNLINRVKSIEQPTKVVVSLKSAEEIQVNKVGSGSGGLWDTKQWNQQNNTMVFNFSNRKDVPDYIENDGMNIRRKQPKSKVGEAGIIVLDATLDASTTDEFDWDISRGPPSPCDVFFLNDNVLINGRSSLSKQPRNHKHRIQFDDAATRTFEYPSEASMLEGDGTSADGETSGSGEPFGSNNTRPSITSVTGLPSLLGAGALATYTPSKFDLTSEGFELGITRATISTLPIATSTTQPDSLTEVDYLKPAENPEAWGSETTPDMLF